jgi:hypothetical protein
MRGYLYERYLLTCRIVQGAFYFPPHVHVIFGKMGLQRCSRLLEDERER